MIFLELLSLKCTNCDLSLFRSQLQLIQLDLKLSSSLRHHIQQGRRGRNIDHLIIIRLLILWIEPYFFNSFLRNFTVFSLFKVPFAIILKSSIDWLYLYIESCVKNCNIFVLKFLPRSLFIGDPFFVEHKRVFKLFISQNFRRVIQRLQRRHGISCLNYLKRFILFFSRINFNEFSCIFRLQWRQRQFVKSILQWRIL